MSKESQGLVAIITTAREPFSSTGASFSVQEWRGSGPATLHVHHADDEAWHVLDGILKFRFSDRTVDVAAGYTVFVPAGVAHTYEAVDARYLIILTPRVAALIQELQRTPDRSRHPEIYRAHESELLESQSVRVLLPQDTRE
jgi:mannose-6-phosphate isomerase-like protein (cupin superfamily)